MWLLSTERAELKFFTSPESVLEGYAILSHVWDEHEETFQTLRNLQARCAKSGENPRDFVGAKIRESCILAERHGWAWIWIDTCCIDKTSSAELSEAINSMFRYYSLSAVCYAFLRDVPATSSLRLDDVDSPFRHSRWHKRGWTLQELVAPKLVIFVSSEWNILGHKAELADLLKAITRIPVSILRSEQDISDVSLAGRMSWASDRQTTRAEDEAYSLMGIFGINMPTLYGEGRRAFYRLQEEIMRTSVDTSLFVWGRSQPADILGAELSQMPPDSVQHDHFSGAAHLLAPSPRCFSTGEHVEFNVSHLCTRSRARLISVLQIERGIGLMDIWQPRKDTVQEERTSVPILTIGAYGVRARIPIVDLTNMSIAVLFCKHNGVPTGLALTVCSDGRDADRPLYHCNAQGFRLVSIPVEAQQHYRPRWKTVYITAQPPFHSDAFSSAFIRPFARALAYTHTTTATPFRIPSTVLTLGSLECVSVSPVSLPPGWIGDPPLTLVYGYYDDHRLRNGSVTVFSITLGVCRSSTSQTSRAATVHWATLNATRQLVHGADSVHGTHMCAQDHIADWPNRTKSLPSIPGIEGPVRVEAKFVACPMNESGGTLVLRLSVVPDTR